MYAAPDTLAALSATFMRDHKKTTKSAKPVAASASYSTSFTSSAMFMESLESGATAYSRDSKSGTFYPPQTSGSSRQAVSCVQPSDYHRQSGRQIQAQIQTKFLGKASTSYSVNDRLLPLDRRPTPPKPVQDPKFIAPNSILSFEAPSACKHEDKITDAWQVKPKSRNTYQANENGQPLARVLGKQAVNGPTLVPQPHKQSNFTKSRRLTESNSARIDSSVPQSSIMNGVLVNTLSDRGVVGLVASKVSSTLPNETTLSPNPGAISGLPAVQNINLQASLHQGIGVKRRLGMGRSTTGYSNKKFKPV